MEYDTPLQPPRPIIRVHSLSRQDIVIFEGELHGDKLLYVRSRDTITCYENDVYRHIVVENCDLCTICVSAKLCRLFLHQLEACTVQLNVNVLGTV